MRRPPKMGWHRANLGGPTAVQDAITLDWSGLEVLPVDQCEALLREHHVGRVGFVDAGSPVVLPVDCALDGHAVVFRTGSGSELVNATLRRPVCFEIDLARLDTLAARLWSRPDLRHCWVRIVAEEISGRRTARPPWPAIRRPGTSGAPPSRAGAPRWRSRRGGRAS